MISDLINLKFLNSPLKICIAGAFQLSFGSAELFQSFIFMTRFIGFSFILFESFSLQLVDIYLQCSISMYRHVTHKCPGLFCC